MPAPEIVHENQKIVAVCKPGGLLTQAPSGIDSMEVRLKRYLAEKQNITGKVYLGVPHRLDRPASGVMVFAKDKKSARFLAEQFQRRQVRKIYWTLVSGNVNPTSETWQDWMRKVPDEARSEICEQSDDGAQKAILHQEVIHRLPESSLLQIRLETGRSHQIRVQSSSRGFPIHGDELYGSPLPFGPQTEDMRLRWMALHARELTIVDPQSKQEIALTADLPEHWPKI